jgi:FAD:protein FMN transferase
MLEAALGASRQTGGLVDPTLGDALEAAGYDRDFAALSPSEQPAGPAAPARPGAVTLLGRVLVLHGGVRLDLNGVVKAAAVDDSLRLLSGPGFVSAGGDLATRRVVDVALPGGGAVRLLTGGLATSGRSKRRWLRAGEEQHHLIDPATGRPSESPWDEVTACGATCLAADVAAKAAFPLGDDGPDWLDERGLPGRFLAGARVHENDSWRGSANPGQADPGSVGRSNRLTQDAGVAERVAARLRPDADPVRARAHRDLRQQLAVARANRVDNVVPAP